MDTSWPMGYGNEALMLFTTLGHIMTMGLEGLFRL